MMFILLLLFFVVSAVIWTAFENFGLLIILWIAYVVILAWHENRKEQ